MDFTFNRHFYNKTAGFWFGLGLIVLILWPIFRGEPLQLTVSNWILLGIGVMGTLNSLRETKRKK